MGKALIESVVAKGGAEITLTLSSPKNRNALSKDLIEQLADALARADKDQRIRVVVVTGSGTVFCSGADLKESRSESSDANKDGRRNPEGAANGLLEVFELIETLRKPVVARVNGHVRGGGIGLLCACDFGVAICGATFAFSEVRVGVAPAMIAVPILRSGVTKRDFLAYALTGRTFDAQVAKDIGLLGDIVETESELDRWVDAVCNDIISGAPNAISVTKSLPGRINERTLSWQDAQRDMALVSRELFESGEAKEGMRAFGQKRAPRWELEAQSFGDDQHNSDARKDS